MPIKIVWGSVCVEPKMDQNINQAMNQSIQGPEESINLAVNQAMQPTQDNINQAVSMQGTVTQEVNQAIQPKQDNINQMRSNLTQDINQSVNQEMQPVQGNLNQIINQAVSQAMQPIQDSINHMQGDINIMMNTQKDHTDQLGRMADMVDNLHRDYIERYNAACFASNSRVRHPTDEIKWPLLPNGKLPVLLRGAQSPESTEEGSS
jgi:exonuclease VII large subunit